MSMSMSMGMGMGKREVCRINDFQRTRYPRASGVDRVITDRYLKLKGAWQKGLVLLRHQAASLF